MRPAREPLSRERVLQTALDLVDREGLEALSMRRLGAELGVEAMSLYNHVPNKAALLDGVYERVLSEVRRPRAPAASWVDHARDQARALRRALTAHPHAVILFATRPAATTDSIARLEEHLAVLHSAGFRPLRALEIVQCISAFVVGHTLSSVAPRGPEDAPPYASLDAARFPNVRAAAAALGRHDPEREFERGLDALLAGLASEPAGSRRGPR